jgi:Ca2+-binding EF-hand superfamily protein
MLLAISGKFAELFSKSDKGGKGSLSRQEFAAVLTHQRFGLSEKLINRVLSEADENDDGRIEYKYARFLSG